MHLVRRIAIVALLVLSGVGMAGAGEKTLHLFTWADYFEPEVIALFESENKCRVVIDYFDSNEAMYAKILAGGEGYDIITPSAYMSGVMARQELLAPISHDLLPNLEHLAKEFTAFTEDPELVYSIPYTLSITGIGYNRNYVAAEDLGSWAIFSNAALARRMTMLNDMRETVGAALKYLGYSLNTTNDEELEQAFTVLAGWKKNLAKFEVDEAKIGLGAGEFFVVHGYNGDIGLVMEEIPEIGFYIPDEGSSFVVDDFVVPAKAPDPALAHAFINHMLDPEVAALNMAGIRYYMPNASAEKLLGEDLLGNPAFNVRPETLARCEVIRDLGPDNAKYIKVWDLIKSDK